MGREPEAVRGRAHGTRSATIGSPVRNTAGPPMQVDPADATVTLEGRVLAVDLVSEVPLNRRYLLA
jgi:hypothetical protein